MLSPAPATPTRMASLSDTAHDPTSTACQVAHALLKTEQGEKRPEFFATT